MIHVYYQNNVYLINLWKMVGKNTWKKKFCKVAKILFLFYTQSGFCFNARLHICLVGKVISRKSLLKMIKLTNHVKGIFCSIAFNAFANLFTSLYFGLNISSLGCRWLGNEPAILSLPRGPRKVNRRPLT